MNKTIQSIVYVVGLAAALAAAPVQAQLQKNLPQASVSVGASSLFLLTLDGRWATDPEFMPVGGAFSDLPYWVSSYPVRFSIVGWYAPTDLFEVDEWINGAWQLVFKTPDRPDVTDFMTYFQTYSTDPSFCFALNRYYSSMTYVFPPGRHVLRIRDVRIWGAPRIIDGVPWNIGTVAFKATEARELVPRFIR